MIKTKNATLTALVAKANQYLKESPDSEKEGRKMLCTFVSAMLMEANKYSGFNYLYWLECGCEEWTKAGQPEDKDPFIYGPSKDETRVMFY